MFFLNLISLTVDHPTGSTDILYISEGDPNNLAPPAKAGHSPQNINVLLINPDDPNLDIYIFST